MISNRPDDNLDNICTSLKPIVSSKVLKTYFMSVKQANTTALDADGTPHVAVVIQVSSVLIQALVQSQWTLIAYEKDHMV